MKFKDKRTKIYFNNKRYKQHEPSRGYTCNT